MDRALLEWIAGHRTHDLNHLTRAMARLGGNPTALAVLAAVGAVLVARTRAWRMAAQVGASMLLALAAAETVKAIVARPRPPLHLLLWADPVPGSAMPSTHAAWGAAAVASVAIACPWGDRARRWTVVVGAVVQVGVGAAMVYLGAHWLSDVLVGWLLGVLVAVGVDVVADRIVESRVSRAARTGSGGRWSPPGRPNRAG